jgi:hypothetical protein
MPSYAAGVVADALSGVPEPEIAASKLCKSAAYVSRGEAT